jgi:uncharacterized protein (TIGR03083 family)
VPDFSVDEVTQWGQPQFVAAWRSAHDRVVELARGLDAAQWSQSTPCPGWTVGDVVAHLADLESISAGDEPLAAEVSEATHPHAAGPIGLLTERGVEARRGRSQAEVVDELADALNRREAMLEGVALDSPVGGPFGEVPLERLLKMRTFDAWVHEQDIRRAVGMDGGWDGDGAKVAAFQMLQSLPFVWGKKAGAQAGQSARLVVTGPGLVADARVIVGDDGRAVRAPAAASSTVVLTLGWPSYMRLSCGRSGPVAYDIDGDGALGERLVEQLNIAP